MPRAPVKMFLPMALPCRSCPPLLSTRYPKTFFHHRRSIDRALDQVTHSGTCYHQCRSRSVYKAKRPSNLAHAASIGGFGSSTGGESPRNEKENNLMSSINRLLENPVISAIGTAVGVWCACLVSLGIVLRTVDNSSGTRMAIAGLVVVTLKYVYSFVGLFRKGRFNVMLGLAVKPPALFLLVRSYTMYMEEYCWDLSLPLLAIATGTGLGLFLMRKVMFSLLGEVSKLDENAWAYLKEVDMEKLQSRVALQSAVFAIFLFGSILFPFMDEVLFRGIYLTSVAKKNTLMPIGWSALLYSAMQNGTLIQHLFYLIVGGVMGVLYVVGSGNVFLPIVAHSLLCGLSFGFQYKTLLGKIFQGDKKRT